MITRRQVICLDTKPLISDTQIEKIKFMYNDNDVNRLGLHLPYVMMYNGNREIDYVSLVRADGKALEQIEGKLLYSSNYFAAIRDYDYNLTLVSSKGVLLRTEDPYLGFNCIDSSYKLWMFKYLPDIRSEVFMIINSEGKRLKLPEMRHSIINIGNQTYILTHFREYGKLYEDVKIDIINYNFTKFIGHIPVTKEVLKALNLGADNTFYNRRCIDKLEGVPSPFVKGNESLYELLKSKSKHHEHLGGVILE